jgi:hypothetical protein
LPRSDGQDHVRWIILFSVTFDLMKERQRLLIERFSRQRDAANCMDPSASREVYKDSSTPEAFIRAMEWLSYCVEHDGPCAPPDKNFVPKRLVNVNLENKAGDPFLVEPTMPTKYACLSYCWGEDSDDVLRTTQGNIEAHFVSILLEPNGPIWA